MEVRVAAGWSKCEQSRARWVWGRPEVKAEKPVGDGGRGGGGSGKTQPPEVWLVK